MARPASTVPACIAAHLTADLACADGTPGTRGCGAPGKALSVRSPKSAPVLCDAAANAYCGYWCCWDLGGEAWPRSFWSMAPCTVDGAGVRCGTGCPGTGTRSMRLP